MATVAHPHIEPAEYVALQTRAGWRMDIELIDGEAVVIPPTGERASSVQGELFFALRRWQGDRADRGLILQDVFVAFPEGSYLAPDISWWGPDRRSVRSDGALESIPDLVVEVLSQATRANDLGVKRELYMRTGVRELWLADPEARSVTRVRPSSEVSLGRKDVLDCELLDGFALDLTDAFR